MIYATGACIVFALAARLHRVLLVHDGCGSRTTGYMAAEDPCQLHKLAGRAITDNITFEHKS